MVKIYHTRIVVNKMAILWHIRAMNYIQVHKLENKDIIITKTN